jgi:hypothetical protein
LAGLCSWQQSEGDAPPGRGVYPPVSPPCAPQGLHAHPKLRPPRQSPPHRAPGCLSGRPRCPQPRTARTGNRRSLPHSHPRNRSQTLPALRSRKAAPRPTPSASPSRHRTAAPAMGRLTRTGRRPALIRMNRCASPLRRPRPTPPQASLRPCLPLTLPGFRTILAEHPKCPIDKGNLSHDRRPEPTRTASRPYPAPYNPQGS